MESAKTNGSGYTGVNSILEKDGKNLSKYQDKALILWEEFVKIVAVSFLLRCLSCDMANSTLQN